ncbi:DMT family transporter [Cellulomonas dongxiuzhuiae]|uniref:DMT family transporter n=1 Tax=Cellulomonas dongxiuzhuiae TaxID=2819979 RepID=A0ABX8GJD8_9CELL|nr:EamA family transporter [Cellulomonas dongxiuzhuiae]MBO3094938.1 EamA family transporter [Cellulomonas dongxiuzhuiae]QWC15958.1 DMT family transporter [Cellulomonas dongxiuzhuiae]
MPAILAVLLAAVCFGTTGTAQALGPASDPVALGAARIAVGGIALAAVAAFVARRRGTAPPDPVGGRPAPGSSVTARASATRTSLAVALGALGVLAYQPAFFLGTARNGVAVGTVVALGSAPVLTGIVAWATGRERPGRTWLAATALATAGVAVLGLAPGHASTGGGVDVVGVLASLGAGAAYALYTLAGAALIDGGWTSTTSMGAMFGVAGVLSLGVLAVVGTGGLTSPAGLATVLWLGLVTTTLAYVLFGYGLARLGAATVATLTLAEPLTATVLGLAVLGERLSGGAVLGLVVLACGLVVLGAGARRSRPVGRVTPRA